MDFSIALPTPAEAWRIVARAEELGFRGAWFYDTQMLCADVFVAMAAAAMRTSRIRLGTGVLVPSNRIAPVAAGAFASLNQLAPGRIDFGVGTGFTARRTMGLGAMKLADMAEYVRIVQGLLADETITWSFEEKQRKIRFLDPELGLVNTMEPVPLHVSAFGPRSRALTAELGAGWLNYYRDIETAESGIEAMRGAWAESGRPGDQLRTTIFSLGCVLGAGEGPDHARALKEAGPLAAVTLHRAIEGGVDLAHLPEELRALVASYGQLYESYEPADARYLTLHKGHLMYVGEDEARYVTPELIAQRTLTGSVDQLGEKIRRLDSMGYDELAIQLVPGGEGAIDDWARVRDVL